MAKSIIYDAKTGETTIVDMPEEEIEIPEVEPLPTTEERLEALEQALLEVILNG
jgi:hypothetical protein